MQTEIHSEKAVLTIAGSDPSGGAGIQADLKTFTCLGVYAGAVISCLTVQNTRGVLGIQPVDAVFVKQQINAVLTDLEVTHIKIGMLGSADVTSSICEALAGYGGEIIYDPVLISSSGQELIDPKDYDVIRYCLLPLCTVITPNVPELSILSEEACSTRESLQQAAGKLFQQYNRMRSIIITGGHFEPEKSMVTDMLLTATGRNRQVDCHEAHHPRIDSRNTHGTGCTFSAALTAYHFHCGSDTEAFRKATEYMDELIRKSASAVIGHGTGPLMHHRRKP